MLFFDANAEPPENIILLDGTRDEININPFLSVYDQRSDVMDIDSLRLSQAFLPFSKSKNTNYRFAENGLWLHAQIINQAESPMWFLSIRYSFLEKAQIYLFDENEKIYSLKDGNQEKSSSYALPTFNLTLPKDKPIDIYIYVKASSLNTLVPIYLNTPDKHSSIVQFEALIWGLFYGALLLFFAYAAFYALNARSLSLLLFFVHLCFIFLWQLLWSGHVNFLPAASKLILTNVKPEHILICLSITATLFTIKIIPSAHTSHKARNFAYIACAIAALLLLLLSFIISEKSLRFGWSYSIGFACAFASLWLSISAYLQGFSAGKSISIAWLIAIIGSVCATIYINGSYAITSLMSQLYVLSLLGQTGAFLFTIVSKNQMELENEVSQAKADAENNFLVIEEQNVHLDLARKEALKASEVKSQFLANMSHEIRTPLNAIIGFSRELETGNIETDRDEHVRIINSSASDLLNLINDILDFSKMEAGLLTLSERPFSPRELFEDVSATMSKTAHLKQLEFLYDVDEIPQTLIGDALKFKQLLTNLISNALKFTNYGFVGLRVQTLSWTSVEVVIKVDVFDSGIGIHENDIGHIFKAFHQLDDDLNRSYQGTGLGLVICQELAFMMKGSIHVKSRPSQGSTFSVTLPFKLDDRVITHREQSDYHLKHAVLFDPWCQSRRLISKQLLQSGFDVWSFESLDLALQHTHEKTYLFVTLPQRFLSHRKKWFSTIKAMKLQNLIVLYSGPTPIGVNFAGFETFPLIHRLPLTARKIESLDDPYKLRDSDPLDNQIASLPRLRILAVDDMELNLRLLEAWFKNSKIQLDLAFDGESAIAMCEQFEYDIILMDIQMPNLDGIDTSTLIRKTKQNIGTPIIAVTAHALSEEKQHFLNNGMDDFLAKPIQQQALLKLIYQWCDIEQKASVSEAESSNDLAIPISDPKRIHLTIDWELAVQRANRSETLALNFMEDFVAHLPQVETELKVLMSPQNNQLILTTVHKLHGACCYTGVPKLQQLCANIQEQIKRLPEAEVQASLRTLLMELRMITGDWKKRRKRLGAYD